MIDWIIHHTTSRCVVFVCPYNLLDVMRLVFQQMVEVMHVYLQMVEGMLVYQQMVEAMHVDVKQQDEGMHGHINQ